MLKNYFKSALRSLVKNKGINAINIIGLSVGMTATILILLWVQNETSFDNYHQDAGNIYQLTEKTKNNQWVWDGTPLPMAEVAKVNIPEIEKIARINTGNLPVFYNNGNPTYEKKCLYVDPDWFNIFHYDFLRGDASAFGSGLFNIILTASGAKKYFGNRDPIGATLRIDSSYYQVQAIVADPPTNSSFQYTAYIPLKVLLLDKDRRENDEQWGNNNYITFVKLKAGADILSVNKKLTKLFPDNADNSLEIGSISLKNIHFASDLYSSSFARGNHSTIFIFSALAFVLLLVACINYVNLTTANASKRAKEVSVKKIIGAQRIHLFLQFVTESFVMSLIVLISTLILVQLCLPLFDSITGKKFVLPLTSLSMWKVIGSTLVIAFLLNTIYPAVLLSSFKPLNVFRGVTLLKINDESFRKGLVIFQFTISVILIASSIVIYRQMQFIQTSDPGYNRSQVVTFYVPPSIGQNRKEGLVRTIKNELLAQNGIESVTLANQSIVNIGSISSGASDWEGHDTTFNPKIRQLATDADYMKTMQLQMSSGRWFQAGNEVDKDNVILNETAVKDLKINLPAVGQRFTFQGRKGQIIGVVKDFEYQSKHGKTGPLLAFYNPGWFRLFMVRISKGNVSAGLQNIQNVWRKFLPDDPVEYNFLDESFNQLYQDDQRTSVLTLVFALIAVFISSLGLFGLSAFTAEKKTKEIGIRKVLGASIFGITTLLSKDFLKLVCIAIIIGSPIAWWMMNKWIENFAYRIDISWWMFAVAGVVAIMIAFITVSYQSIKAAVANPVKSLRTE
jgi:putative ABC transport system permease protein